jgi:hypothetical protein
MAGNVKRKKKFFLIKKLLIIKKINEFFNRFKMIKFLENGHNRNA